MRVVPLALRGAALLMNERHRDERGQLRKLCVVQDVHDAGLDMSVAEVVSVNNTVAGTLRGMHYQVNPYEETKTLWVTKGRLFDVLVDLRPDEPTYGRWVSVELSAEDDLTLHVPVGIAHGYQTLENDTSLTYLMGAPYVPEAARTLLWCDETVGIEWPVPVTSISDKDQVGLSWPPPH